MKADELKKDRIKIKLATELHGYIETMVKPIKVNGELFAIHPFLCYNGKLSNTNLAITDLNTGFMITDRVINKNLPMVAMLVSDVLKVWDKYIEERNKKPVLNILTEAQKKKIVDLGELTISKAEES